MVVEMRVDCSYSCCHSTCITIQLRVSCERVPYVRYPCAVTSRPMMEVTSRRSRESTRQDSTLASVNQNLLHHWEIAFQISPTGTPSESEWSSGMGSALPPRKTCEALGSSPAPTVLSSPFFPLPSPLPSRFLPHNK